MTQGGGGGKIMYYESKQGNSINICVSMHMASMGVWGDAPRIFCILDSQIASIAF